MNAASYFQKPVKKTTCTMSATGNRIMLPADVDILLGRGKPFQNHPGNQRMLSLVDKYKERYQAAERKEKHDIVEEVMGIIEGSGGRFLRRVDYENYWVPVQHSIAYRKVGHAFRSKARKTDGVKKPAPAMTRERVEAPPINNAKAPANMEEMLLAEMRMRRAALHQADLLQHNRNMNNMNMHHMNNMNMGNMNNIAAMAAGSQLERFLLYNNMATAGLFQPGFMNPNFLAANIGNGGFNNNNNNNNNNGNAKAAPMAPPPNAGNLAPPAQQQQHQQQVPATGM